MSLRARILIPLGVAIALLLAAFVLGIYRYEALNVQRHESDLFQRADLLLRNRISADSELLLASLRFMASDDGLLTAWLAKDQSRLLRRARALSEELLPQRRLTHLSFFQPDLSPFLRVFTPQLLNSDTGRITFRWAADTGVPTHGIELDPDGDLSLRVVLPWKIGADLVGFIEIGEPLTALIPPVERILKLDIVALASKEAIRRDQWEHAMRREGKTPAWDRLPGFVLLHRPDTALPERELRRFLATLPNLTRPHFLDHRDGRAFHLTSLPLADAMGKPVGVAVVIHDRTQSAESFRSTVASVTAFSILIGLGLLGFFYWVIGKLESRLHASRETLLRERQEAEGRAQSLQRIHEIQNALNTSSNPEDVFATIAREIRKALPCQRCVISALDFSSRRRTNWHFDSDLRVEPNLPFGTDPRVEVVKRVYDTCRPFRVHDILAERGPEDPLAKAGFRSTLLVPVMEKGECIAHISASSTRPHAFDESHEALLTEMAGHVSYAIRNASLSRTAQTRAARLIGLNDLNNKINQNLSLDELLPAIASAIVDLLNADHARIWLFDETTQRLERKAHGGRVKSIGEVMTSLGPGEGMSGRVYLTGVPEIHSDVQQLDYWFYPKWIIDNGIHGAICHPLRLNDRVIGVAVGLSREFAFFSEEDLDLLGALSSQAGIAIGNARLHGEVQRSRNFLQSVVGDNALPIIIADLSRDIIIWNAGAESLYGFREEEMLGKSVTTFMADEYQEEAAVCSAQVRTEKRAVTYEAECLRNDGSRVPVSITISPVLDESGKLIAVSGIHKDLTEQLRSERELNQARDAALESTRLKSEFLANMSHEIRTPLNGVIGMTSLLLESDLTAEQREFAETIKKSGEGLLILINDILDFSKIEAGKLLLSPEEFNLRETMEEVLDLFVVQADQKGLHLISLIEESTPITLRGDSSRLRQVLTNLIGNAVKFTDEGEVFVRVGLSERSRTEALLRFDVLDTGIGIAGPDLDHIFDAFSQADGTNTRRHGGTGLGLAISQRLVQMMGGVIGVESRPGEGSRFWFTCRFTVSSPLSTAASLPLPGPGLGGMRALIVEDNANARTSMKHLLEGWKLSCKAVSGPAEAVEALLAATRNGAPYGVVLLDLPPAPSGGFALARQIRANPLLAPTPLILMRNYTQQEIAQDDAALVQAILSKPIRHAALQQALTAAFGLEAAAPAEAGEPAPAEPEEPPRNDAPDLRILVVEDNAVNQMVATRMLKRWGLQAEVASNGAEALEKLSERPFDLILMDCQMPVMDGFEATQTIRRKEAGGSRHIPIVAMTAFVMKGDKERCIEAGMNDYIPKPVEPENLRAVLERWLKKMPPPHSGEPPPAEEVGNGDQPEEAPGELDGLSVLDPSTIGQLAELEQLGDDGILDELTAIFLRDTPKRLEAIEGAIRGGDAKTLSKSAHTLKGSCGTMGASRMHTLCQKLEDLGAAGSVAGSDEFAMRLRTEYRHVQEALASRFWTKQ